MQTLSSFFCCDKIKNVEKRQQTMDKGGSYSECRNTSYRAHRRNCRNSFNLLSSGRHTGCHHSEDHQKDPFRHPDYEMNKEVHIFDFFCCRPAKPFKKSDCRAAVFLYDRKFHFPSYKKTLMRTQRAGNQRLPGNYCLTAIALGASGAHDAYRIRAHTFLSLPFIQKLIYGTHSSRMAASSFQSGCSFVLRSVTSAILPQTSGIWGGRWPRSTSMMTGTPNSFSGSHTAAY